MMVADGGHERVGFIADGFLGSYVQWCLEYPRATAAESQAVACRLLRLADEDDVWEVRKRKR